MGLFSKKTDLLAIDIGTNQVKVALISGTPKKTQTTYCQSAPLNISPEEDPEEEKNIKIEALKTAAAGINRKKIKRVMFSLPAQATISRLITIPTVPMEKLAQMIGFEVEQHIPFPLNEVSYKYQVIRFDYENMDVFLTAIKQDRLDEHLDIVTGAGFEPDVINVSSLATFNLFGFNTGLIDDKGKVAGQIDQTKSTEQSEPAAEGDDGESAAPETSSFAEEGAAIAIIDIGAGSTDISVAEGRILLFTRSTLIAGNSFTEAIKSKFNIGFTEAERIKKEHFKMNLEGALAQTSAAQLAQGRGGESLFGQGIGSPPGAGGLKPPPGLSGGLPAPPGIAGGGLKPPPGGGGAPSGLGPLKPPPAPGGSVGAADIADPAMQASGAPAGYDEAQVFNIVKPLLDRLVTELKRSFDYYKTQLKGKDISKIILTGGTSNLDGLDQFLSKKLDIEVGFLEPAERITFADVDNIQEYSTIIGLGLNNILPGTILDLNLIPDDIKLRRRQAKQKKNVLILSVLGGILVLEIGASMFMAFQQVSNDLEILDKKEETLKPILLQLKEFEDTKKQVEKKLSIIEDVEKNRARWLDILWEFNKFIPNPRELWIDSLDFAGKNKVRISGYTINYEMVSEFITNIKQMKRLTLAERIQPKQQKEVINEKEYIKFSFSADLIHNPAAEETDKKK